MNMSDKNIKFLPHDKTIANTTAEASHHLLGPLTIKSPSTKRKIITAPIYTGPAVNR